MNPLTQGCEINYDGDLLKSVQFVRGLEVRPLWSKLERLKPDEMIFWIDRFDSLCSISSEWALAQAIERASNTAISKRSQFVRTILCELNRFIWLTTYIGRVIGSLAQESLKEQIFIIREQVLSMQEELTGGRILPQALCVGGARRELALGDIQKMRLFIINLRASWLKFNELSKPDKLLEARLRNLLIIKKEEVEKKGWWGIVGKASGISYDSRIHRPHGAYPFLKIEIPTREVGDALSRFQVALSEIDLSLNLIDQLLTLIPSEIEKKSERNRFSSGLFFATAESAKGPVIAAIETTSDDLILNVRLFTCGQRVWPQLENYFIGMRAEDFELAAASLGIDPEEVEA
jgi:ech hydrogenase subunit E